MKWINLWGNTIKSNVSTFSFQQQKKAQNFNRNYIFLLIKCDEFLRANSNLARDWLGKILQASSRHQYRNLKSCGAPHCPHRSWQLWWDVTVSGLSSRRQEGVNSKCWGESKPHWEGGEEVKIDLKPSISLTRAKPDVRERAPNSCCRSVLRKWAASLP